MGGPWCVGHLGVHGIYLGYHLLEKATKYCHSQATLIVCGPYLQFGTLILRALAPGPLVYGTLGVILAIDRQARTSAA